MKATTYAPLPLCAKAVTTSRWRSVVALVCLVLLLPAASSAGIYYKQETTSLPSEAAAMSAEVWVDGEHGRIEILSSGNPIMPAGTYIVTEDAGRTLFLVNPKEKTYSEFDLEAMMNFAGSVLEGLGGVVNFEFTDPQVQLLEESAGESLLGMDTRYVKRRVTYGMEIKVIGIKQRQETESITEIWLADPPEQHKVGLWLRNDPPRTGNEQLDKVIAAESEMGEYGHWVPLRTRTQSTVSKVNKRGVVKDKQTTTVDMRVTEWKQVDTSGIDFKVPDGFEETPLLLPGADDEGGGNPLKGIFKRNG